MPYSGTRTPSLDPGAYISSLTALYTSARSFPKVGDRIRPVRQGETRVPASGHRMFIRMNLVYAAAKKVDGKRGNAAKFRQIRSVASSRA